jgi:hypothetical protein
MYTVQMYHFLDFLYLIKIYTLYRCTIFLIFLSCWFLYFFTLQENKCFQNHVKENNLSLKKSQVNHRTNSSRDLFSCSVKKYKNQQLKKIKKMVHLYSVYQPMTNKNYSPSGHSVIKLSQYKFPTRTLQSSNQNTHTDHKQVMDYIHIVIFRFFGLCGWPGLTHSDKSIEYNFLFLYFKNNQSKNSHQCIMYKVFWLDDCRVRVGNRVCSVVYLAFFQWKIIFFYMILKTIKKYWSLTIFHQPMTNKNYSPSGHSVIKLSQYKYV